MNLDQRIEQVKKGYVAGKDAFTKDEDRAGQFDDLMTKIVANVRSDAYAAFRLMMESELDEAMRHVSEIRFNEGVDACADQGTIQRPENPYTVENIRKQKEQEQADGQV